MLHSVAIGCDPNAVEAKENLIRFLRQKGYPVTDMGSEDPIYANVAVQVGEAVAKRQFDRGILLCGTGLGVCLAANMVPGAYAVTLGDVYSAERARKSNDANIACFGAFVMGIKLMEKLAEIFLNSEFIPQCASQPKVDRIREFEKQYNK